MLHGLYVWRRHRVHHCPLPSGIKSERMETLLRILSGHAKHVCVSTGLRCRQSGNGAGQSGCHTQEVAGSLSHPTDKNRKSLRGKPGENAASEKLRAASAVQQVSRQRPSVSQQRGMQRMLPVPKVMSGREHPNERRTSPMAGTVHRLSAMLPPLSPACH